uniref:Uncharacterized protein n=1 Tax=Lactuca sativa TaxID=4236 RepID=A0A9R1WCQ2_LACSA|nr:hypothetical protein LSAT_V11C200069610 [Lactuca sativa]
MNAFPNRLFIIIRQNCKFGPCGLPKPLDGVRKVSSLHQRSKIKRSSNKCLLLLRLSSTSTATSFKNVVLLLWECCFCANLMDLTKPWSSFLCMPKMVSKIILGYDISGSRCGFLGWVDPPVCQRSTVIIPELLRTMNRYEVEVGKLKMCLLASWVLFLLFVLFWN